MSAKKQPYRRTRCRELAKIIEDLEANNLLSARTFYLDTHFTEMTKRILVMLRKDFEIPLSMKLSLPRDGSIPSKPGPSKVVISAQYF